MIQQVLAAPLSIDLAPHVLELVGRDEVAASAIAVLTTFAPSCTGMIVDALLDGKRELALRRRLPAVLASGEPGLAAWGLWRGLADKSFEIRYRAGAILSRLAAGGQLAGITPDAVYAAVTRELGVDAETWNSYRLVDDAAIAAQIATDGGVGSHTGSGLEHVFTVLGLVLPSEPLRIALHAVQTDDSALRGTALEYLESILPAAVRSQLWPLIDREPERILEQAKRTPDELLADLRQRSKPASPPA